MARLATLRARIALRAARFQTLITPLHAPSFWRRRWLYVLIATPFVLISFKWIWGKKGDIPTWVAQAVESTREFFTEHVSEPSRAIFKELIWNEHESITDVAALEDAKQSLARMLADFVKDTNPKLSEEVREGGREGGRKGGECGSITDVAALEDAKQSLARMLAGLVKDTNPNLSG